MSAAMGDRAQRKYDCVEIFLALFELRSSNNGGSLITPLTLVSILPSINQSEKSKTKQKKTRPRASEMIAN
jgi:hypothetical protein